MISKEEIKRLRKLHSSKGRAETGLFIAEGEKVIDELLQSPFKVVNVYCVKGFAPSLPHSGINIIEVTAAEMEKITQFHTPSPVAAVSQIPPVASLPSGEKLVYLDRISDPGNAGTIIRLCHWFGIHGVLFSPGSVEAWNPKVVQASMGSVFKLPVTENVSHQNLNELKNSGYKLCGAHLKGDDLRNWQPAQKTILLLGNESTGLAGELSGQCETLVTIPGAGGAESLNVATAAAILLYEWNYKK